MGAEETATARPPATDGVLPARLVLDLAAAGLAIAFVGLFWDGAWHSTFPFEDFWSPPHLVLYAGLGLTLATNLGVFYAPVREAFRGPTLRVPPLTFPLPVPLVLLAVGSLLAIFSGMVDQRWHEALKGGESAYSLPHNFTIMGGVLVALGVFSGALHVRRPLRGVERWGPLVLSASLIMIFYRLVLSFVQTRQGTLANLANPLLSRDPNAVALRTRYLELNLLADNTLWAPLALVAAGLTPLVLASALSKRRWAATGAAAIFLGAMAGLSAAVLAMGQRLPASTPAAAMVLPAALFADLLGPRLKGATWPLAALVFTLGHGALYGFNPIGMALAVGGGWLAGHMGRGLGDLMRNPRPRQVGYGLLIMGLIFPVLLGGLDILIRYGKFYWLIGTG